MLDNVILSIGTPRFNEALFDTFERGLRVRQVALYRFGPADAPETLMAQDNRSDGCVHTLVHDYVGGYHRHDPFRAHYRNCEVRRVEVENLTVKQIADTQYAQRLYVEPGIAGKLSLVLRRASDALCLSLYRDRKDRGFNNEDMGRIHRMKLDLAAALDRHLSLTAEPPPASFDQLVQLLAADPRGRALSGRERTICARLLMGYSNEAIALELGISFHSVRTYRRRAYFKLGVTSQNELFSLVLSNRPAAFVYR
jgi:DNA-binding CsgD family transcriptional regulator